MRGTWMMMIVVIALSGCAAAHRPQAATTALAPAQNLSGPGGQDYLHAAVTRTDFGWLDARYSIFVPANPGVRAASAPVVVFLHGYGAIDPAHYIGWIHHLVRRGNIVIYPAYQSWGGSPSVLMTPMAAQSVRRGLEWLRAEAAAGRGPAPDLSRVAIVGHSAGAIAGMNLAAGFDAGRLPVFRAVMAVAPPDDFFLPEEDYSRVPPETLLFTVAGADDTQVGNAGARKLYRLALRVPPERKRYIEVPRDTHGSPVIFPDHGSAEARVDAGHAPDALDHHIYWRLFDELLDAAFGGEPVSRALDANRLRASGVWSDGRPIAPLKVDPGE